MSLRPRILAQGLGFKGLRDQGVYCPCSSLFSSPCYGGIHIIPLYCHCYWSLWFFSGLGLGLKRFRMDSMREMGIILDMVVLGLAAIAFWS